MTPERKLSIIQLTAQLDTTHLKKLVDTCGSTDTAMDFLKTSFAFYAKTDSDLEAAAAVLTGLQILMSRIKHQIEGEKILSQITQ